MISWIMFFLYFLLIVSVGFGLGVIFEHGRMMRRLKKLTEEFVKRCGNCLEYDGDHCMKNWNNADPDYYCPYTDDRNPDDCCEDWQLDENTLE